MIASNAPAAETTENVRVRADARATATGCQYRQLDGGAGHAASGCQPGGGDQPGCGGGGQPGGGTHSSFMRSAEEVPLHVAVAVQDQDVDVGTAGRVARATDELGAGGENPGGAGGQLGGGTHRVSMRSPQVYRSSMTAEPRVRIERTTCRLQGGCSTTEPTGQTPVQG